MTMTKNICRYSVLLGLFAVPFIPFIISGVMFFPFITGKGFVFRILVDIIFGLFVALAIVDPEYRPRMSWITKSVLLFTFVILVADIFGANPAKSIWSNYERMEGFVLVAHLALYYIVISSVLNTKALWKNFFNTTIFASLIMSGYGVLQLLGVLNINQGGVRVDATFGNATYLAIYLVFHFFLCLYMLVGIDTPKWQKWAYGLIAALEVVVLYYTATRGAILGLIGGLAVTGLVVLWKERENKTIRKAFSYSLIAVAIVVVGFAMFRNTSVVKNSQVLSRFSSLGFSEFKTQGRYFVWPMALKGFAEKPILGWGQENFNFVFNKYYDPNMFGQEEWFDRTHNIVLDWLIAGGILGLLSYILIYFALFYYIWRKDSTLSASEKGILTGMVSAYIFHNMFVFDNLISYIMFFSVLAFVHFQSRSKPEVVTSGYTTKNFSPETISFVEFPAVALFTVGLVYFVNVPALSANLTLIEAITPQSTKGIDENLRLFRKVFAYNSFGNSEAIEQLVSVTSQVSSNQSSATPAQKQAFYDLAKTKVEEKVKETPHDARYLVFAGSFFNRFSQYDEAIKYLDRAIIESPKKQSIKFELGSSYLGKANYQKMFSLFEEAYNLQPDKKESQILYAIAAIYTKNDKVLKMLSTVLDQDTIIFDNRFLNVYANIGDYASAINILNARLAKEPNNTQYKLSLASAYASIGQKQKAISLIQELISADPNFKAQGDLYIKQILGQ